MHYLVAFLKYFDHGFHPGDVGEDGFSSCLTTLIEGILILSQRIPIFGKEVVLDVVPDSVDIILVVLTEDEASLVVVVDRV